MLARRELGEDKSTPIPEQDGNECVLLIHFNGDITDSSKYNWDIKNYAPDLEFPDGKFNKGVQAPEVTGGNVGYLQLPDKIFDKVLLGDWTIEFWANFENYPSETISKYQNFLKFCNIDDPDTIHGLSIDVFNTSSGQYYLDVRIPEWKDDETGHSISGAGLQETYGMAHCCIMKKFSSIYIFINGELEDRVAINSDTIVPFSGSSNTIYIPIEFLSSYSRTNAIIDELRIYSKALYSTRGFTPPTSAFTGTGD